MSMKGWAAAHRYKGGILKYLYDKVKTLDSTQGGDDTDIAAIKAAIGKAEGEGAGGILKDIADIKAAIGKAEGEGAGGILKDIADIKAAIGTDDTTAGGLKKRCADIETAIGADDQSGTIKGRIYALEEH